MKILFYAGISLSCVIVAVSVLISFEFFATILSGFVGKLTAFRVTFLVLVLALPFVSLGSVVAALKSKSTSQPTAIFLSWLPALISGGIFAMGVSRL